MGRLVVFDKHCLEWRTYDPVYICSNKLYSTIIWIKGPLKIKDKNFNDSLDKLSFTFLSTFTFHSLTHFHRQGSSETTSLQWQPSVVQLLGLLLGSPSSPWGMASTHLDRPGIFFKDLTRSWKYTCSFQLRGLPWQVVLEHAEVSHHSAGCSKPYRLHWVSWLQNVWKGGSNQCYHANEYSQIFSIQRWKIQVYIRLWNVSFVQLSHKLTSNEKWK